jgi:hypothetical protein
MNTFVVLTGLMLLVPDPSGKTLTVLVLDTPASLERNEVLVHTHETTVHDLGAPAANEAALTGDWSLESKGSGSISIVDASRFMDLDAVYGSTKLESVIPECLGASFETDPKCMRDKKPMVRARLTFSGEWSVQPISINLQKRPRAAVIDDSHWGFVQIPAKGLPLAVRGRVQHLAGGVVLSAPSGKAVEIKGPSSPAPLKVIGKTTCKLQVGVDAECSILRFRNTPMPHAAATAVLEIENDVDLIYDLLKAPPAVRYLPFMRLEDAKATVELGGGGLGSPDPRPCPPALVKSN